MATLRVAGRLKAPESNYPRPPCPVLPAPPSAGVVPVPSRPSGVRPPPRWPDSRTSPPQPRLRRHLAQTHAGVGKDGAGSGGCRRNTFIAFRPPATTSPSSDAIARCDESVSPAPAARQNLDRPNPRPDGSEQDTRATAFRGGGTRCAGTRTVAVPRRTTRLRAPPPTGSASRCGRRTRPPG